MTDQNLKPTAIIYSKSAEDRLYIKGEVMRYLSLTKKPVADVVVQSDISLAVEQTLESKVNKKIGDVLVLHQAGFTPDSLVSLYTHGIKEDAKDRVIFLTDDAKQAKTLEKITEKYGIKAPVTIRGQTFHPTLKEYMNKR